MSEQGQVDNANPFKAMAETIELNKEKSFSGAFVIAPPGRDTVEIILLNNKPDPAMFWSLVRTRAEIALAEIQQEEKQGQNWGR